MKFKFDSNLDYQNDAVNAVVDLFKGQGLKKAFFTVTGQTGFDYVDFTNNSQDDVKFGLGVGNKLLLSPEDILENLRAVQKSNNIPGAKSISPNEYDFNIEMETGTGKTYVYLKTIFELNKLYGFTKFIIVVPSIAIKEGVYKTLQITEEHFKGLYANEIYNYFVYDSSKLEQIRNFAVNSNIEIMIINIDAFNKSFEDPEKEDKSNIIHRENDKLSGYKPIDLIAETNPIVIIDEPQSVISYKGDSKSPEAIAALNPLCTLRYSATHRDIQNLIYKLDAVDAYEKELVKGIEVAGIESTNSHNKPYMKLISVNCQNKSAKIEVDKNKNGTIKRETILVYANGSDLSERSLTNRSIYEGYIVDVIDCTPGDECVTFTQKDEKLKIGVPVNDWDKLEVKAAQIKKTIENHLDKELDLSKKGIKVLSLFFIDSVPNYREYDDEGNAIKGPYAEIFEREYKRLISLPKYQKLNKYFDLNVPVDSVHDGYFAIDKTKSKKTGKTVFKEKIRQLKSGEYRLTNDDKESFNLIMKDKERLLSFDEPLRFIFSHSALREGWDNPNVFQICTLNETNSNIKKRQEIGRGLRLCVNQDGERIKDSSINILTIMANESYESFAESLQTEYEDDAKIKFGIIEEDSFATITMRNSEGVYEEIGIDNSCKIFDFFVENNYINLVGKAQEALKTAIATETVKVPEEFEEIKGEIISITKQRTRYNAPKNASNKRKVSINEEILMCPEFLKLWNIIKRKTTYSVDFNTLELINKCSKALSELEVSAPKLIYTKSKLVINRAGVSVDEDSITPASVVKASEEEIDLSKYDIISIIQNETFLTRKTIVKVLIKSGTLDQFKKNPQEYIESAIKIIKRVLNKLLVDGIKYTQLDEKDSYSQELFKDDELNGYIGDNLIEAKHSLYNYVKYDSDVELEFAKNLESDPEVLLYTKLPKKFKIRTPIGNYNPDWAIVLKDEVEKHKVFFVIETKGTTDIESLRGNERCRITCGKKHFNAISEDIVYDFTNEYNNFKTRIVG